MIMKTSLELLSLKILSGYKSFHCYMHIFCTSLYMSHNIKLMSKLYFACLVSDCGINAHKHCKDLVVMECRSNFTCSVSDCGINAHKHCKDLVVMECRSKQHAACNRRLDSLSNGKWQHVIGA